jgi:transmembrane sensor
MNDRTLIPQEISEDAADWFGRLQTERPSEAIRSEFVAWLTRSPVHVEEFLRVSALHRALSSELKADPEWLAGVLADSDASDDNVVWMEDVQRPTESEMHRKSRRSRWSWAAAAAVLLAAGIGAVVSIIGLQGIAGRGERFATAVGEQRQVVLADGSSVLLNTDTEIRVRMSHELRHIELVRGEAIFDVAKDPERPLRVLSGSAAVQAIGTRFVVYRQEGGTVVTVVQGTVLVSPIGRASVGSPESAPEAAEQASSTSPTADVEPTPTHATGRTLELHAGQRVTVAPDGRVAKPAPADVETATSWARGRMVFDSATLEAVVTEFNRYNVEHLVILDAALNDRRISGVFKIGDPEDFVALLSELDGVSIMPGPDGRREIRLAPGQVISGEPRSPQPALPRSR